MLSPVRCHRGMRQEAPKDAEPGSDAPRCFGRGKELESWLNAPGHPNWIGPAVLETTPSLIPRGQSIPDFGAAFGKWGMRTASSTWSKGSTPPPCKPWSFPARLPGWGSTHRWSRILDAGPQQTPGNWCKQVSPPLTGSWAGFPWKLMDRNAHLLDRQNYSKILPFTLTVPRFFSWESVDDIFPFSSASLFGALVLAYQPGSLAEEFIQLYHLGDSRQPEQQPWPERVFWIKGKIWHYRAAKPLISYSFLIFILFSNTWLSRVVESIFWAVLPFLYPHLSCLCSTRLLPLYLLPIPCSPSALPAVSFYSIPLHPGATVVGGFICLPSGVKSKKWSSQCSQVRSLQSGLLYFCCGFKMSLHTPRTRGAWSGLVGPACKSSKRKKNQPAWRSTAEEAAMAHRLCERICTTAQFWSSPRMFIFL